MLDYIHPILQLGTVLYFDDWKDPRYDYQTESWGEHRAWNEWSQKTKVEAETIKIGVANERFMVISHV